MFQLLVMSANNTSNTTSSSRKIHNPSIKTHLDSQSCLWNLSKLNNICLFHQHQQTAAEMIQPIEINLAVCFATSLCCDLLCPLCRDMCLLCYVSVVVHVMLLLCVVMCLLFVQLQETSIRSCAHNLLQPRVQFSLASASLMPSNSRLCAQHRPTRPRCSQSSKSALSPSI
jgi:hypothetical protein